MRPAVPPPHDGVRESYELERSYATRILAAAPRSEERRALLREAYDRFGAEPHVDQSEMVMRALARGLAPGARVLEIGCGHGALVARMLGAGLDAFGTDVSPECIQTARAHVVASGIPGDEAAQRLRTSELFATPFDGAFDGIVLDNVIEHIAPDELAEALGHCLERLVPGGRLLILTPHRFSGPHDVSKHFQPLGSRAEGLHLHEYSFGELEGELRRAGFGRVLGFPFHPRLLARWGIIPSASSWAARKARWSERLVPGFLLRWRLTLNRVFVALLFPAICVAVKDPG